MKKYIYLEFTNDKIKSIIVEEIRKYIGEGINACGIFETREDLLDTIREELEQEAGRQQER